MQNNHCLLIEIEPGVYQCQYEGCANTLRVGVSGLDIQSICASRTRKIANPPTTKEMATNLAKAIAKHAKDLGRYVTEEEYAARLEVCKGNDSLPKCGFYDDGRCLHKQCGCFLSVKARWRSEKCPIDKWC